MPSLRGGGRSAGDGRCGPGASAPPPSIVWAGASEADPRTPEFGTRGRRPAPLPGCPRARPGAGRADRRRRLRLRARALRRRAGAALGGTVLTFGALFGQIATAAGSPPGAVLSPAQRRRCVEVAVEDLTGRLGPLRRSAGRPGFAAAFARLLDELQAAGVGPRGGRGERRDPRGLRLPRRRRHPLRRLRGGARAQRPARRRRDRPRGDRPARRRPRAVGGPAGLPIWARRPHPGPVRPGRGAGRPHRGDRRGPLRARATSRWRRAGELLGQLRERLGLVEEETPRDRPGQHRRAPSSTRSPAASASPTRRPSRSPSAPT